MARVANSFDLRTWRAGGRVFYGDHRSRIFEAALHKQANNKNTTGNRTFKTQQLSSVGHITLAWVQANGSSDWHRVRLDTRGTDEESKGLPVK